MKESKLFRSLVATFVVIVLSGPAVVLAGGRPLQMNLQRVLYRSITYKRENAVLVLTP